MREELIKARIEQINNKGDYAYAISKMTHVQVAFRRTPAILTTICIELMVSVVIARNSVLLKSNFN
jgi:hypothetical protein